MKRSCNSRVSFLSILEGIYRFYEIRCERYAIGDKSNLLLRTFQQLVGMMTKRRTRELVRWE